MSQREAPAIPSSHPSAAVSCCVLAKNEAAYLPAAIRSAKSVADEILLVDNGSVDNTSSVARALGATVLPCPRASHDEARSEYVAAARGDWILVLDADERLDSRHSVGLRGILGEVPADVGGFHIPCFNYYGEGRWCCTWICRLWRNSTSVHYAHRHIHSSVVPSIVDAGMRMSRLYLPIHHIDGLAPGRTQAKRSRNVQRILNDLGNEPGLRAFLALEYEARGDHEIAVAELRSMVSAERPSWTPYWTALAHLFLARFLLADGNHAGAQEVLHRLEPIREHLPDLEHVSLAWAESYTLEGNYDAALECVRDSLTTMEYSPHMWLNFSALTTACTGRLDPVAIRRALALNPRLLHPILFRSSEAPNIYRPQTSFLTSTPDIYRQLASYEFSIGNCGRGGRWNEALETARRLSNSNEPTCW